MDILKDKSYLSYDYTNINAGNPTYYNTEDEKYLISLGNNMLDDSSYTIHKVNHNDALNYLALKYYGSPIYWWVIADFNHIVDPFITLDEHFTELKIPNITSIKYGDLR